MPRVTFTKAELRARRAAKRKRPLFDQVADDQDCIATAHELARLFGDMKSIQIWLHIARRVDHDILLIFTRHVQDDPGRNPAAVMMNKVFKWNGNSWSGILPGHSLPPLKPAPDPDPDPHPDSRSIPNPSPPPKPVPDAPIPGQTSVPLDQRLEHIIKLHERERSSW